MSDALQRKVHKHAAKTCANHTGRDGCILMDHGKCVLSFEADRPTANVCPYFMTHVLPGDEALQDEYLSYPPDDYPLKPASSEADRSNCAECGRQFVRRSNRSKYCDDCKPKVKREQANRWARNKTASK